jgi:hypothetical protein
VLQQSEKFAERLRRDVFDDTERQVDRAYRLCFGRTPDEAESSEAVAFIAAEGLPAFCRAMLNSNEFVFLP